jgi:hypothetical protein
MTPFAVFVQGDILLRCDQTQAPALCDRRDLTVSDRP